MNVLQINSVCGTGSTGRIATDIHNLLLQQGHESYIAYGRNEARNCDNSIRIGSEFDNYKHFIKSKLLDKHGLGSKKATLRFIKDIERINPDIIHLHNIHGYYLNIEVLFNYLKISEKPVVWTLHDCWAFTGHCTHFDYIGCEKWKTGCYSCPQLKEYPSSIFKDNSPINYLNKKELFSGIKNLTIVTPSHWLANLVRKSFLSEYEVKVINNGIDLDSFNPIGSNFKYNYGIENKFMILGVANIWNEKKGFQYFLELSKSINKNQIIVLVGLTEKQLKQLPPNIIGISRTDSIEELASIYCAANIFINPTLEDTFPTTNLEAQACGTPVITFNTGGSIESILDSNSYVVEKGELMGVINILNQLSTEINKVTNIDIVKEAQKKYSAKDRYKEYINLYHTVNLK